MLRNVPVLLITAAVFASGCSTLTKDSVLKDSVLSDENPAPASMAPPDQDATKASSPDPLNQASEADYHFTLGESYSFNGQTEKAIEEFKLTLVYDPSSVSVRLRLAAEFVRAGMVSEAVEQAELVVQANPDSDDARMFLGGLYTGMKMYEPAMAQFKAVVKHSPDNAEAATYMGAILAEQKDYAAALQHFEGLLTNKEFPDKEKAYFYIGKIQAERGPAHFAEAEQAYHKALIAKPDDAEVVMALGSLYKTEGHEDKMVKTWRNYVDKNGPEKNITRALGHYYMEHEQYDNAIEQLEALEGYDKDNLNVKIQIALILIQQKKLAKAATELEEIVEQAPELDKVRFYLAAVDEELGKKSEATEQYLKVPPPSSYYADATIHAAHLMKEAGKPDEASEVVKSALVQRDDVPQLYAYYGALLDDQKKYQEALTMLQGAVEKFPDQTQLRFYLGSMYDRLGDTNQSISQMKKVLDLDRDNVQAMNFLAYTYAESGRELETAESLSRRALELQPQDGYILDTVGWVLFKRGKMEESIRYLERAFHAKADEAVIAEHLGDAYLRFELWQKALRMYRKAADLETDTDKAARLRAKVANAESQRQRPLVRMPASSPASH
jgi:tetratricopeptide (TPR) repeat protein